jgi:hypothetical protein
MLEMPNACKVEFEEKVVVREQWGMKAVIGIAVVVIVFMAVTFFCYRRMMRKEMQ